jgi:hypothetical protein
MTPSPGSRWRARTRKHRGWIVEIVKTTPRSIEFRRMGHREPANKRCFMAAAAFLNGFALEHAG